MADHPLHPATVHWPITFLSTSYALDILYAATVSLRIPYLVFNLGSSAPEIARISYYALAAGLVFAFPAIISGGAQMVKIVKNGGLYETNASSKGQQVLRPKVKIGLAHAAANDVVAAVSAFSWYVRRSEPGNLPTAATMAISLVLLPLLLFSAKLGGTLTYNYGAGMSIGKKGKSA